MKLKKKTTKKTDHDPDKYITILEFNKLTVEHFGIGLAQAYLACKNDIANYLKKTGFDEKLKKLDKKVISNKTKHLLVENELKDYKHLIQVFLLVQVILIMIEHNFT